MIWNARLSLVMPYLLHIWCCAKKKQLKHFLRGPSRGTGRWRKKLLVIFVSLGIIGSFWLFWHLNTGIMQRREETLANMCDERARMLQDQFNVSMNHVHALAILVSTFHHGKHPSAIDQVIYSMSFSSLIDIFPLHLMQTYSWPVTPDILHVF